jgi:[acyl-carrier-protein] S-malonyltransferase
MGKMLYDSYDEARQVFMEANEVLGFDLSGLCFRGSIVELNSPENMFPAIVTVSVAAFRVYMRLIGVTPLLCAGHSLGEYSALVSSGAVSFGDALRIVRKRGYIARKVSETLDGSMTVVDGIDRFLLEELCRKVSKEGREAVISCYNSAEQFVIAGNLDAVMDVEDILHGLGAVVTPVLASAPFHCFMMEKASEELREELAKYEFYTPRFPVVSNVEAKPYASKDKSGELLVRQLTSAVRWRETMEYFKQQRINTVIELGPQNVLRNLTKANMGTVKAFSFLNNDDRDELKEYVFNSKNEAPLIVDECLKLAASIKNKNWDINTYNEGVIKQYRNLEKLRLAIVDENRDALAEEADQALKYLMEILKHKGLSQDEQLYVYREICGRFGLESDYSSSLIVL